MRTNNDAPSQVHVRLVLPDGDEVDVGTLRPTNVRATQSATFQYDAYYLADPRAYPIDPELPLVDWPTRTSSRAQFRCMSDSTPDRWGRALLDRAANRREQILPNRVRATLELDYLLGVRDDTREGALRFFDTNGEPLASELDGVPNLVALESLLALTDEMLLDPQLDVDIHDLVAAGSSLGGARPKASVVGEDGQLMIAKFPNAASDAWDVPAWEKLVLDLAADCGIDVPPNRLIKVLDRNVLVLERFDRDGGWRIGYVSGLTMASANDGDHSVSFADLAEFIEPFAEAPDYDLPQLFRRALFGLAVSNTDNHLRNHGFLRRSGGWALAPAFDINPSPQPGTFAVPVGPGDAGRSDFRDALECSEFSGYRPPRQGKSRPRCRKRSPGGRSTRQHSTSRKPKSL